MKNSWAFKLTAHPFLFFTLVALLIQLFLMLSLSLKDVLQSQTQPMLITQPFHWENYELAWKYGVKGFLLNSITLTVAVVIGSTFLSALVSYVFARYNFLGKNPLFTIILSQTMIPWILIMVPLYTLIVDMKLIDTFWAYILPMVLGANVIPIMVLRTSFAALPEELFESARLDGAGHMALFFQIGVPLVKPTISAMAVLTAISVWNDYLWPLMVLRKDSVKPISVGLLALAAGSTAPARGIGPQMAGSVLSAIPLIILFIFAMQSFIRGLTAGSVKM